MHSRRKGRELALRLLYGFDLLPRDADDTLREFRTLTHYPEGVMNFAEHLVCGTLSHKDEIDAFIVQNAINWSLERMAAVDRNILRLAVYELLYEKSIPPKVSINEALEISKKYSTPKSSAFINGILDHIHQALTSSDGGQAAPSKPQHKKRRTTP